MKYITLTETLPYSIEFDIDNLIEKSGLTINNLDEKIEQVYFIFFITYCPERYKEYFKDDLKKALIIRLRQQEKFLKNFEKMLDKLNQI